MLSHKYKNSTGWNIENKSMRIQICLSDFNIIHVPRAYNQILNFLTKAARSFHRELHFIGCSIPVWLPRLPQI